MNNTEPSVGMVSLGCPKALVDAERILTQLRVEGYRIAPDYAGADLVVVNTCGFIDSAVAESLDAIGEALNENGKVIVTGCLGARAEQVLDAHPGVLAVTGPHAYEAVMSAVHQQLTPPHDPHTSLVPPQGIKLTPRHYAYLKISEGCNHRCSFCIIPSMRGDLDSRPLGEVLEEAGRLVSSGVRELMIIAQDSSAYGVDLGYREEVWQGRRVKTRFYELLDELGELDAWIRMHYVYPYPHVDRVIELMAAGRVLPYMDVPLQHASPRILKNMRRPAASEKVLDRIRQWRSVCPGLTLRSTFIVGFPGETEADFEQLLAFLEEAEIDRVGCFAYSDVEGAAANSLPGAVPEEVKQERQERLMALQEEISSRLLARRVGTRTRLLIDEIDGDQALGRSFAEAPEVDGVVWVDDAGRCRPGEFVHVEITSASEHDLGARLIEPD